MAAKAYIIFLSFIFIGFWAPAGVGAERQVVFVSIAPQKYFVQQIGGDRVQVRVMVPSGASPETYEPKPRQMAELTEARVYFAIGVPFEDAWLKKIAAANPNMEVVQTDDGIEKIPMDVQRHSDETRAPHAGSAQRKTAERGSGEMDPHIWLSPPLVKIQARTIMNTLQEMDPAHRSLYATRHDQFAAQIDRLDAELKAIFADTPGLRFMVFHPSWGYFARTYGLQQVPIETEGKDPKPAQLQALIEYARKSGINLIFVQPQFSNKSARLVAKEIGGQVAFADPLAEDWMTNLYDVAAKFKAALK